MPIAAGTNAVKQYVGEYDFAVDGGAVSTITLRAISGGPIPIGSIILSGVVEVITQLTSGGAETTALTAESAADILAATAVASMTVGNKSIIPAGTGATAIKTTAERSPSMTIAVAALTAGKFRLRLLYL
jgi:hypothetical protein